MEKVNALLRETQADPAYPVRMVDLAALSVRHLAASDPARAVDYAKLIQRNTERPLSDFLDQDTIQKLRNSMVSQSKSREDILSPEISENIQ